MYLAQARNIPGVHVVGIADINVDRAKGALALVDWPSDAVAADIDAAIANRTTVVLPEPAAPLTMIEKWDSRDDLAAHAGSPAVKALQDAVGGLIARPTTVTTMTPLPAGTAGQGEL